MISRRLFLSMAVATQLRMLVRSTRPEDLEMPIEGFADFITPIENFFVRSHTLVPKVDLAQWKLKVDGHVSTPLSLTMEDLKTMPSAEVVGVLECAGNGRAFYQPPVAGIQWDNGAVGNGRWRGVRLVDVLKRAGLKPGTVDVLFDGADVPLGSMEDFQRSIPLLKATLPETILAFEMNGETLPVKHGFPLRAVVPGWAGDSWTKWMTGIRVLNEPAGGFWMKNAYLHPGKPVAPGTVVPANMMQPVTSLRVKSVIAAPLSESNIEVGKPYLIRGAAWTGAAGGRVAGIDVSVDQGRKWSPARLTGPATPFGWRLWEFSWTPAREQRYTVLARARDTSGDTQPLAQEWNPSGYLWNVVARVDVNAGSNIGTSLTADADAALPQPPPGFRERCLVCHEDEVIRQQRLTRAQWDREITKMTGWGARVAAEDRQSLLDYLVRIAGPR